MINLDVKIIENLKLSNKYSEIIYGYKVIKIMNQCKHWACNLKNKSCVGCGIIICPNCLREPSDCRCDNKDNCCKV